MVLYSRMFYAMFFAHSYVSLDGKTTNDTIKTCHHRNTIIICHRFVSDYVPPNLGRLKMNLEVVCSVTENYMIYTFFSLK